MKRCTVCQNKQNRIFTYQKFTYYRCPHCNHVSTYPFPNTEIIKKHYEKQFIKGNYNLYHSYIQPYTLIYLQYVHILKEKLSQKGKTLNGKRILDVGCYTGDFLVLLQKENAQVYGLELQADAVKMANKKLHGRVLQADIMTYKFPKEKYDVITLLGVIEHVTDPMLLLRRASSLLKKDGILLIQTPNSSSLLAKVLGKYWPPYSPVEHIHLFSSKSLVNALNQFGFKDVSIIPHWKNLPISYVYNQFNTFGPEFHKLLSPFSVILNKSHLTLPFYGGEMITIAMK